MTTSTRRPPDTVERRQGDHGNGKLNARMWIGQNPFAYAAGCLLAGYWFGRATVRGRG